MWAFGVLIWELFALPKGAPNGGRPYNDIDDDNEVSQRVMDGSLQLSCDGPPPAADVMSVTLAQDAAQRPTFKVKLPSAGLKLWFARGGHRVDVEMLGCCRPSLCCCSAPRRSGIQAT